MTLSDQNLEKLILQFQNGDQDAARKIFECFRHQMAFVASKVAQKHHTPQHIDIEGVVNSGFRSFFSAAGKTNFNTNAGVVGGLLMTIIRRKALVRIRKLIGKPRSMNVDSELFDFMLTQDGKHYLDSQMSLDLTEILDPIFQQLTSKEKGIIAAILNPFEERSFDDLAEDFRTSKMTIDNLWKLVQKKLKQILKRKDQ